MSFLRNWAMSFLHFLQPESEKYTTEARGVPIQLNTSGTRCACESVHNEGRSIRNSNSNIKYILKQGCTSKSPSSPAVCQCQCLEVEERESKLTTEGWGMGG